MPTPTHDTRAPALDSRPLAPSSPQQVCSMAITMPSPTPTPTLSLCLRPHCSSAHALTFTHSPAFPRPQHARTLNTPVPVHTPTASNVCPGSQCTPSVPSTRPCLGLHQLPRPRCVHAHRQRLRASALNACARPPSTPVCVYPRRPHAAALDTPPSSFSMCLCSLPCPRSHSRPRRPRVSTFNSQAYPPSSRLHALNIWPRPCLQRACIVALNAPLLALNTPSMPPSLPSMRPQRTCVPSRVPALNSPAPPRAFVHVQVDVM
ncbi:hypothetical protein OF83DRAFT_1176977 [Amylostereum chailletii]|nr:hypothetical protein OF83DRAFT_1176977 [Amylostereum chailletii]